ncbi:MAG: tRNA (cytidine(56)-2'-O)-methyltransferase [Candidatus Altiarchaeales archaeon IMC4]|nr:MAG: tRNA (cytidine(56)-2'-O)-methyltransferase [Candidatus Altiarchaeales archaeon IMC4]
MKVTVLRLGHRFGRDHRISTHLCLVARAFGAAKIVFDEEDRRLAESVGAVIENWGGDFSVEFTKNWKKYVESFAGEKIHLTMYGINVNNCMGEISSSEKDKLVIVGGKKVPSDLYEIADYNVAVGSQPHSEVAALSVFLDRLFSGRELGVNFGGKREIVPKERGKLVVEKD